MCSPANPQILNSYFPTFGIFYSKIFECVMEHFNDIKVFQNILRIIEDDFEATSLSHQSGLVEWGSTPGAPHLEQECPAWMCAPGSLGIHTPSHQQGNSSEGLL